MSTSIETLCRGFPPEFALYLTYVRNLRFDETPDYTFYRGQFRSLFKALSFNWDFVFDWTLLRQKSSAVQQHSNAAAAVGGHGMAPGGAIAGPAAGGPGPSGSKMMPSGNTAAATVGEETGFGGTGGKI